ncbi:uncharacterized protein N7482_000485 [Penicillium canariense]|uniref:Uncharacterized protein n=1 Tax=Penicillium canariense TaxID=189055 RepID=A0A9W9IBH5_9EURO|nr:uncharacterized protein N7482_000485 [Penicillium canariense]KAJ5174608.1 hypothetical protein N7482_000485 [Penicillium canariense]
MVQHNAMRALLPNEILITIAGHLEPEACYALLQGVHGLEGILPKKEFRRQGTWSGNTIIHLAAQRGDLRLTKSLYSRGVDIHLKNRRGITPLAAASRRGNRSLVEFLISTGATVNAQDKRGLTALHNAAYKGADRVVQILLDAGADPFLEANHRGTTALDWACKNGHLSTVALLFNCLEKHEEIPPVWGSALEIAAKNGRTAVVQFLIDSKFEISDRALHLAVGSGNARTVKLLLSHKDFCERVKDVALPQAAMRGYHSTAKALISLGMNISNDDGLLAASLGQSGSVKILRALSLVGVDFSKSNNSKPVLLSFAASRGNTGMVKYLAHLGWLTPDIGIQALSAATRRGQSAVAKIFLDHGFKLDTKDEENAISEASDAGHLEILKLFPGSGASILSLYPAICQRQVSLVEEIMNSGIDTSSPDRNLQMKLRTCLWHAVQNGDTGIVRLLLNAGVSPETQGFWLDKPSALYRAAQRGHLEIVKLLVQAGADVCRENHVLYSRFLQGAHGYTALYTATTYRHLAVMKYLIHSGASVFFQGAEGHTVLHAAARSRCSLTVSLLLEAGADVSIEASCGGTPLHYAAQYGRLQAVQILLHAGADPLARNRNRRSPRDLAMDYDYAEVAAVLEEAAD